MDLDMYLVKPLPLLATDATGATSTSAAVTGASLTA